MLGIAFIFLTSPVAAHAFSIKRVEQYWQAHQPLEIKYLVIEPEQTKLDQRRSPAVKDDLDFLP